MADDLTDATMGGDLLPEPDPALEFTGAEGAAAETTETTGLEQEADVAKKAKRTKKARPAKKSVGMLLLV